MRFLSTLLLCLIPAIASAQIVSEQSDERLLTVYNQNESAIYDIRKVNLEAGMNEIQILNIPELFSIDRISVFFDKGELVDVRYPVSQPGLQSIMDRLSGNRVKLIRSDETHEGVLDHYQGTITLTGPDGMMLFDRPGEFIYSPLDGDLSLIGETALTLRIYAEESGQHEIGLLYGNRQIGWAALHSIRVHPETKKVDWFTEAHVLSRSESDMNDVRVRLLAGEVLISSLPNIGAGRVSRIFGPGDLMATESQYGVVTSRDGGLRDVVVTGFSAPAQESLADFFVYNLPGTFELRSQELSTIILHENTGLNYAKEHYFYITGSAGSGLRPAVFARLNDNEIEGSTLSQTLPSGSGYVSSIDVNNRPDFESNIFLNMVSPGDAIYLPLREASPVIISESYSSRGQRDDDRHHFHTLQLENTGDETVCLFLRRNVSSGAQLIDASLPFERRAGYLQTQLSMQPGETLEVSLHILYPAD
ncbi:MAG: hypothetical protein LAT84_06155 [Balneolia bacterium]|nr:hypothetical protein [Balneolia bacterium]